MTLAVGGKESGVEGVGTINFFSKLNGQFNEVLLRNVLYNPNL